MKSIFFRSMALIFVVAGALAAGLAWQALRFVRTAPSTDDTQIVFEVRRGQTLRDIAVQLEKQNLITDQKKFRLYVRFKALENKVRAGEYALKRNMSPGQILKVLASGRSIEYAITISEGLNRFEIASLVEKQGIGTRDEFLKLTQDRDFISRNLGVRVPTLEGYLFPETYYVTRAAGVRGLVVQMLTKFKETFTAVPDVVETASSVALTRAEIVVLASIIEKETGAPFERPRISSVFHNRLKKGMRLQTDPTVIYGLWSKTGTWNRNISRQDLLTPSAYNTYTIRGLPPGPIANPGREALLAAVQPETSEFLFFVSRNDGTHVFSKDYQQHRAAVGDFQLNRKAREGKSWRDLKNPPKAGVKKK